MKKLEEKENITKKSYNKSVEFLRKCSTKHGFIASVTDLENYRRVWARDGCITGLAALLSREKDLIDTFKRTLKTLGKYQGRQGQIPSNVDAERKRASYGMTSGRVDASLWYIIGFGQYFKHTKNKRFLEKNIAILDKTMNILEAWEYNEKDFIFIPDSGDWADESPRHGYILYDQLIYYQALCEYSYILDKIGKPSNYWKRKSQRLKKKISTNFWMREENIEAEYIYHPEIFDSSYRKFKGKQKFWLENFHHHALYKRFDAFANILTILLDFSDKVQAEKIFEYVSGILGAGYLVPAFFPIISPKYKKKWKELKGSYSFHFKNRPYHSHNGGLWPMLTGFYIGALIKHEKKELAYKYLINMGLANSMNRRKDGWGFYEYHHGLRRTPEGTKGMAWSAAAGVIGYKALQGEKIFR
jgi:glycogen debranching enzyme